MKFLMENWRQYLTESTIQEAFLSLILSLAREDIKLKDLHQMELKDLEDTVKNHNVSKFEVGELIAHIDKMRPKNNEVSI
tara:strand:- start:1471 stop:1710 length:240 start_codon:yes stop_codon:yes gene_type:complete